MNTNPQFDVFGASCVPEHHDERNGRYVSEIDQGAIGAAFAWLAFYAIAAVAVIASSFHKAADVVVAGCQSCN